MELSYVEFIQLKSDKLREVGGKTPHLKSLMILKLHKYWCLLGHEINEDEVVGSCSMDAINKHTQKEV